MYCHLLRERPPHSLNLKWDPTKNCPFFQGFGHKTCLLVGIMVGWRGGGGGALICIPRVLGEVKWLYKPCCRWARNKKFSQDTQIPCPLECENQPSPKCTRKMPQNYLKAPGVNRKTPQKPTQKPLECWKKPKIAQNIPELYPTNPICTKENAPTNYPPTPPPPPPPPHNAPNKAPNPPFFLQKKPTMYQNKNPVPKYTLTQGGFW